MGEAASPCLLTNWSSRQFQTTLPWKDTTPQHRVDRLRNANNAPAPTGDTAAARAWHWQFLSARLYFCFANSADLNVLSVTGNIETRNFVQP